MTAIPANLQHLLHSKQRDALHEALLDKTIEKMLPTYIKDIDIFMSDWLDTERPWPQSWYTRKKAPASTPLARFLRLPPTSPAALQKFLDQLSTLDAASIPPITCLRAQLDHRAKPLALAPQQAAFIWSKLALADLQIVFLGKEPALAALLQTLHTTPLPALHTLTVEAAQDAQLAAQLVSGALPALRDLTAHLTGPPALTHAALASHQAPQLERLVLSAYQLTDHPFTARWPALHHLSLTASHAPNDLLLAALHAAPALRYLDWRVSSAQDLDALAHAPAHGLTTLCITGPHDDAQLAAILSSPLSQAVETLILYALPRMGEQTAQALRRLPKLHTLQLIHAERPNVAFWSALMHTRWPTLRALHLGWSRHAYEALTSITTWDAPALTSLSLAALDLHDPLLALVERAPWLDQLTELVPPSVPDAIAPRLKSITDTITQRRADAP